MRHFLLLLSVLAFRGSLHGPPGGGVMGFNLDTRIPIVKRSGVHEGALFGFSVAQHREVRSSVYGEDSNLILVGAPKDHNLQPGTNSSGALYKCWITPDMEVRDKTNVSKTHCQCFEWQQVKNIGLQVLLSKLR